MDVLTGLAEALPPGLYSGAGVERYVRQVFAESDRTDDFRLLESELYLVGDRPRHLRAGRLRRAGLGRRADLEGGVGVDRTADGLPPG